MVAAFFSLVFWCCRIFRVISVFAVWSSSITINDQCLPALPGKRCPISAALSHCSRCWDIENKERFVLATVNPSIQKTPTTMNQPNHQKKKNSSLSINQTRDRRDCTNNHLFILQMIHGICGLIKFRNSENVNLQCHILYSRYTKGPKIFFHIVLEDWELFFDSFSNKNVIYSYISWYGKVIYIHTYTCIHVFISYHIIYISWSVDLISNSSATIYDTKYRAF